MNQAVNINDKAADGIPPDHQFRARLHWPVVACLNRHELPEAEPANIVCAFPPVATDDTSFYDALDQRPALQFIVDVGAAAMPAAVNAILPYLFLPGYFKIDNKPCVLVSGMNTNDDKLLLLKQTVTAQGFADICILHSLPDGTNRNLYKTVEEFASGFDGLPGYETDEVRPVFIVCEPRDAAGLSAIAEQLAANFRQRHPVECAMLDRYSVLLWENKSLHDKQALLLNELDHFRTYNEILRNAHPDLKMQQHYNTVYEALPAWFRKVGHALRMITGKRTGGNKREEGRP